MILPSRKLKPENSLIYIGARVLRILDEPKTVSRVWQEINENRHNTDFIDFSYDWFVLALDLLFLMHSIELREGRIRRIPS